MCGSVLLYYESSCVVQCNDMIGHYVCFQCNDITSHHVWFQCNDIMSHHVWFSVVI